LIELRFGEASLRGTGDEPLRRVYFRSPGTAIHIWLGSAALQSAGAASYALVKLIGESLRSGSSALLVMMDGAFG